MNTLQSARAIVTESKTVIESIKPEQFSPENQQKVIEQLEALRSKLHNIEWFLWMKGV